MIEHKLKLSQNDQKFFYKKSMWKLFWYFYTKLIVIKIIISYLYYYKNNERITKEKCIINNFNLYIIVIYSYFIIM